jgi:hypothetical protein
MAKKSTPIHSSIKKRLGYDDSDSDEEVLADWTERKRRVCKPCWELKYCPYGPLVEQSPILPSELSGIIEHNKYLQECVDTGLVGSVVELDEEQEKEYAEWLGDEQILLSQAAEELRSRKVLESASQEGSEEEKISAWLGDGELPPPHLYRAPFSFERGEIEEKDYPADVWNEIKAGAEELRKKYSAALKSKRLDLRHPIEPARRAWFEQRLKNFRAEEYPEHIPETFLEGSCNVFGHICPVYFAAEEMTETEELRRIGRRHLNFETMMRIVRRDDYRCQHCKEKLLDDEVEFDHIIPVSKGGSSEEHNLRLTCFDCNRDKSDSFTP